MKHKYPKMQELWNKQEDKKEIEKKEKDLKFAKHQYQLEKRPTDAKPATGKAKLTDQEIKFQKEAKEIMEFYAKEVN